MNYLGLQRRRKFGNGFCNGFNGWKKEVGQRMSVKYVTDGRRKLGNGFCNGFNGCTKAGSTKQEAE
jgi:hypothetical protein